MQAWVDAPKDGDGEGAIDAEMGLVPRLAFMYISYAANRLLLLHLLVLLVQLKVRSMPIHLHRHFQRKEFYVITSLNCLRS